MGTGTFQRSRPNSCQDKGSAALVLDGRLSEEASDAFLAHAQGCQTCRDELIALQSLNALAAELPKLSLSPGEERRLEVRLLERARQSRTSAAIRTRVWLPVAASLVALTLGLVLWQRRPTVPALAVVDAPSYEFLQPTGAVMSIAERGPTTRVRLESGYVELRVRKLHAGQRFLVDLPDGELEVKGTQFSIDAIHMQTERVLVTEGVVELRLRGRPSVLLRAGDGWSSPNAAASVEVEVDPPAAPAVTAAPALIAAPALTAAPTKPTARPPARDSQPPASSAPVTSPGVDFASAMQLFTSGGYAKASEAFVRFSQAYPADSRAEDALYLAAASRSRLGDKSGARELAQGYLERYPKGFRSREAAVLAHDGF